MKHLGIVRCHTCNMKLIEFEESKFHALEDYWAGARETKPYCRSCYYNNIDKAKQRLAKAGGIKVDS